MEITVTHPGGPGTSFTENVKDKIVIMYDVLEQSDDFESVRSFGTALEPYGFNWNYTRNILPFLQNCGIVKYRSGYPMENAHFFTNIGCAYVDVLKSIKIVKDEPQSAERDSILNRLERIQEIIYFQCLVIMMKNKECGYAYDFFDVLRFVDKFESIDQTEYLLIQYQREKDGSLILDNIKPLIDGYRDGSLTFEIKSKTKNDDSGAAKSVNSFPYVQGNFQKAGVFFKDDEGRSFIVKSRLVEVKEALREGNAIWQI